MTNIYREGFLEPGWKDNETGWNRVVAEFAITGSETVEPDAVFATYERPPYEGYALVAYRRGDKAYLVEGSHCSCFGLEGQWEPTEYANVGELMECLRKRGSMTYPSATADEIEIALLPSGRQALGGGDE